MSNSSFLQGILSGAGTAGQQVRILSDSEKHELERVHGLQVRTAAANLATALCGGVIPEANAWLSMAKTIEQYILDGSG